MQYSNIYWHCTTHFSIYPYLSNILPKILLKTCRDEISFPERMSMPDLRIGRKNQTTVDIHAKYFQ